MGGDEGDFAAVVNPHGVTLRHRSLCEAFHICAVEVHRVKLVVALVELHALIAHSVENLLPIRRHLRV